MQQITGQIQSTNVKRSGNSNGKNWTIYEVTINGQKFDTFDSEYSNKIGQSGTFDYEVITKVNNGRTYQNNRLGSFAKRPAAGSGSSAGMAKLDLILKNQEEIISLLHSLGQNVPAGEDQGTENINVEDIPF